MARPVTQAPVVGRVQETAKEWREMLDNREVFATKALTRAYLQASNTILAEVGRYARMYETAVAQGKATSPSWMFQAERMTRLLESVETAAGAFSGTAADRIQAAVTLAATAGDEAARALTAPPTSLARLPGPLDWATWSTLPQGALDAIVGAQSFGPLSDLLLTSMAPDLSAAIRDQLTGGLAAGHGINRMLRNIRETTQAHTLNRARTILRTETHRAYREATHQSLGRNADVVASWQWLSAADATTCAFCWGMHGTTHLVAERMHTHPNCRCTMLPRTESWATLAVKNGVRDTDVLKGLLDVEDAKPLPLGEPLFRSQPEALQRAILGPTRFQAFQEGQYGLRDFYRWEDSNLWGSTPRLIPLREMGLGRQRPGAAKPPDRPGGGAAPAPARVLGEDTPPWDFADLDEAEAWMRARFPQAKVTMEKEYRYQETTYDPVTRARTGTRDATRPLNLDMVKPTLHELDRLARLYPEVMGGIKDLGFKDFRQGNVYAHANADLIEWNTGMFSRPTMRDLGPNRSMMSTDFVERGANREAFHPAGIPEDRWIASVTTHEFGHSVAFWARYRTKGLAWSETVARDGFGRLDHTMYTFFSKVKMTGGAVSTYARKTEEERWAEAFSAVHFQPQDRWKPYTRKVKAAMDTMFGPGAKRVAKDTYRVLSPPTLLVTRAADDHWDVVGRDPVTNDPKVFHRVPITRNADGEDLGRGEAVLWKNLETKRAMAAIRQEAKDLAAAAKAMGLDPEDLGL